MFCKPPFTNRQIRRKWHSSNEMHVLPTEICREKGRTFYTRYEEHIERFFLFC
jgi:hypothetical protein